MVILKNTKLNIAIGFVAFVLLSFLLILYISNKQKLSWSLVIQPINTVTPTATSTMTPTSTVTPTVSVRPSATQMPASKILFGIGSQAGPAMEYKLVKEAPVHMLTSWYNGTKDLEWMRVQQNDLIPRLYANKYVVHLITWTDLPEEDIETPYGKACGRPYPVSKQVVEDMKQLAQIYTGNGSMYVTLFTEFQTYTCTDNNWNGNENYWKTLQDNYRKIKDLFHQYAPQSKVALSWGGWQNRYEDVEHQGGRSLFAHFADVLKESDFTAFQTMESDSNVQDIIAMTTILSAYKRPVMLAHYKPSSGSEEVFNSDMKALFTDDVMQQLINKGLFAMSFMDDEIINNSDNSYSLVKNGILKYGK